MKYLITYSFLFFSVCLLGQTPEEKLSKMGIDLPEVSPPIANYVKWRRTGNLVFLSGHVPSTTGVVGKDISIEEGYNAARETGISLLATLKQAIGSLDKVAQVIKVEGMVQCVAGFHDQPKVINGCSDLLVEVFGDAGHHARVALGQVSLPSNRVVEISMIVEIKED
jgi:enamine deaminase RidA (YjgF/YER057c/UK114 family)